MYPSSASRPGPRRTRGSFRALWPHLWRRGSTLDRGGRISARLRSVFASSWCIKKRRFRHSVFWVSDYAVDDEKKRERRRDRARTSLLMPPRESRGSSSSQSRSHLFSLAKKKNNNNNARYYKTTKQKIEQREENDESSSHHRPLTSKLFALNPFDAGVANVNDDVFSPETCVVVSPTTLSSSLVSTATTTLTPGLKATTHNTATQKAQNTTKAPHLR